MQNKSLEESLRSRLALGQTVELGALTVFVHRRDVLTDVIFALGANADDQPPWRFEVSERGRSTRLATIDEVIAHLARTGAI
jgi:hypothetical protein